LRFVVVQPILSIMPAKLKTLIAAAGLGAVLGIQTPIWSLGMRTHFTFDAVEGGDAAAPSASASGMKWISKRKVSMLWAPRAGAWVRMIGGDAAVVAAYALTVFAVLRIFGVARRGNALAVIFGGILIGTLIDIRFARSGASPPVFIGSALVAASLLGSAVGMHFALRTMKKAPA
jgi:hypothetical protein